MYTTTERIVLASASPRRRGYLRQFGIEFDVVAADIDESPLSNEMPLHYVARIARAKNLAVLQTHPERCIISADTIVFLGDTILGKPQSDDDAVQTLMLLSSKVHSVATALCIGWQKHQIFHEETVITQVEFADISVETARAYVRTGEPRDKAGAYGIQGRGGALVKELRGSYSNVVGLPLNEMLAVLSKYGIVKTK
jgi:septum formation protein